jgi:hypothetical protein
LGPKLQEPRGQLVVPIFLRKVQSRHPHAARGIQGGAYFEQELRESQATVLRSDMEDSLKVVAGRQIDGSTDLVVIVGKVCSSVGEGIDDGRVTVEEGRKENFLSPHGPIVHVRSGGDQLLDGFQIIAPVGGQEQRCPASELRGFNVCTTIKEESHGGSVPNESGMVESRPLLRVCLGDIGPVIKEKLNYFGPTGHGGGEKRHHPASVAVPDESRIATKPDLPPGEKQTLFG